MRLSRRRVIVSTVDFFKIPTYSGSHAVFGDEKRGYIELYSSGVLTFPKKSVVDLCIIGRGKNGSKASGGAGAGGAGGTANNQYGIEAIGDYTITIGGTTSALGYSQGTGGGSKGGSGGSGGDDGTGVGGGGGAQGSAVPFGGDYSEFNIRYGGGGGGGGWRMSPYWSNHGSGGSVGGGAGGKSGWNDNKTGSAGTANTGGGGGGGAFSAYNLDSGWDYSYGAGGSGGSGRVIIRWGYDKT